MLPFKFHYVGYNLFALFMDRNESESNFQLVLKVEAKKCIDTKIFDDSIHQLISWKFWLWKHMEILEWSSVE